MCGLRPPSPAGGGLRARTEPGDWGCALTLDWIKVRNEIHDDPKVVRLADITDRTENEIVGALVFVWGWADRMTTDGSLGVSVRGFDRRTGIPGFADALVSIGWATVDENGSVSLVNYSEHNGATAKKRAKDRIRKAQEAKAAPDSADVPPNFHETSAAPRNSGGRNAEGTRKGRGRDAEDSRTIEPRTENQEDSLSAAAAATAEREPDPPAGEPERPAPKPKPEPRPNPVWDAIAARWFPSGITPREESRVGALARDFGTKIGDADPARAIEAHVEAHRRKFPNVQVVTPESVLKHWDALIPPKRAGPAAAAGTWRDLSPRAQRAVHDALLAERPDLRGIGFLDDRLTVEYVRFVRERGVPTPEGAGA